MRLGALFAARPCCTLAAGLAANWSLRSLSSARRFPARGADCMFWPGPNRACANATLASTRTAHWWRTSASFTGEACLSLEWRDMERNMAGDLTDRDGERWRDMQRYGENEIKIDEE